MIQWKIVHQTTKETLVIETTKSISVISGDGCIESWTPDDTPLDKRRFVGRESTWNPLIPTAESVESIKAMLVRADNGQSPYFDMTQISGMPTLQENGETIQLQSEVQAASLTKDGTLIVFPSATSCWAKA